LRHQYADLQEFKDDGDMDESVTVAKAAGDINPQFAIKIAIRELYFYSTVV